MLAALFADRIAVMYLGRIVEIGPVGGVPHHWDTAGLKPSARTTKPGTQRVPGGLIQATQVAFVKEAEGFSPTAGD